MPTPSSPATALRLKTIEILEGLPTFGVRVYDSRTTPLAESDVPCLVVFTKDAATRPQAWPPRAGDRSQELKVFAEFDVDGDTPETADAALGAAADAIEYAVWNALHGNAEWTELWKDTPLPTWQADMGRSASSNRRRCTVEMTCRGSLHQDLGERTDVRLLQEIRAAFTEPDGAEEGYDGPVYRGRVPLNIEGG